MVKNHPALIWRWLGRVQKSSNKRTKVTTSHRANYLLGRERDFVRGDDLPVVVGREDSSSGGSQI
jgi:hypothetical protein